MNSQDFLILNGIVIFVFIVLFWRARRPKPSVVLRLKNSESSNIVLPPVLSKSVKEVSATERQLTVFFEYQGKTYEAHQVLNIPAGASPEHIVSCYQKLVLHSQAESGLLKAALKALLDRI